MTEAGGAIAPTQAQRQRYCAYAWLFGGETLPCFFFSKELRELSFFLSKIKADSNNAARVKDVSAC